MSAEVIATYVPWAQPTHEAITVFSAHSGNPLEPPRGNDKPSPEDMGKGDVDGILYLNISKEGMPERFKARATQLREFLELTGQWLSIHAGLQTKKKLASEALPKDDSISSQVKRSSYRSKVVDVYLDSQCPWVYQSSHNVVQKSLEVKKVEFHFELLKLILEGIIVPGAVKDRLEKIFKGISDTIVKTEKSSETQVYWILLNVLRYDSTMDELRPALRTISYAVTQGARRVVAGKTTIEDVTFDLEYMQKDYTFRENDWNRKYHDVAQRFVDDTGAENSREPIDVDV